MNRKLHNTVSALVASSALLVLSLVAAVPLSPEPAAPAAGLPGSGPTADHARALPAAATTDAGAIAHAAALASAFDAASVAADAAPTPRKRTPSRRGRHSVAMPYFSFAPRG